MPYPSSGGSSINKIVVNEYFHNSHGRFFIEAGSCDGIFQSNTYFLETELNWSGILVEPNPDYFKECILNRPKSKVYNCALVSSDYLSDTIDLYSIACKGAMGTVGDRGIWANETETPVIHKNIPTRTLTSILDELNPPEINFMSLDVEGYEVNVLSGLDFNKYRPEIILVESFGDNIEKIKNITSEFYYLDNKISDRDYIFKLK